MAALFWVTVCKWTKNCEQANQATETLTLLIGKLNRSTASLPTLTTAFEFVRNKNNTHQNLKVFDKKRRKIGRQGKNRNFTPGLFVILHKQHLTQCQICSCNTNLGNCHIRFSFSLNYVHSLMIETMKINYCKLVFPKSISSRRSLQLKCLKRELHITSLTVYFSCMICSSKQ